MKLFKKNIFLIMVAFLALPTVVWGVSQVSVQKASLTVNVIGIASNEGSIRAALYNNQAAFEYKKDPAQYIYQKAMAGIKNQQATLTFSNLPYGVYAIKLFHDKDNSEIFKRNLLGVPQEGFGVSDNPKIDHHSPTFDQTKFVINQPKMNITINMINP